MDKGRFEWEQSLVGFRLLVDLYTNNEDTIIDPMMGTGTTLLAAWQMHRPRVIGIEQDAKTFRTAEARLTAAGLVPGQPGGSQRVGEEAPAPTPWRQLELAPRA